MEDVWKSKSGPVALRRRVEKERDVCSNGVDVANGRCRFGLRYVRTPPSASYSILDIRTLYDLEHAIPDFNTCEPTTKLAQGYYIQDRFCFYYKGGSGAIDV